MTKLRVLKRVRLGDVLEKVVRPVDVKVSDLYQEIGVRSHGKGVFHKKPILGASLGEKRVFHVEPNCLVLNIVFAWEQAITVTTEHEVGMIASHRFPMWRSKGKVDVRFLALVFQTKRGRELLSIVSPGGAGRNKTLNQSDFEDIELPIPPLAEQLRVIEVASTWERAIEATEAVIAAKRRRNTALLARLIGDYQLNPGSWRRQELGTLARIVSGATPSTASSDFWDGTIPWCTPTDLSGLTGRTISTTERMITERGLQSCAAEILPTHSVILCSRASVGECAVNLTPMATNQGCKSLVPSYLLDIWFAYHLVRTLKRTLQRLSAGSTFLEFPKSAIEALVVAIPNVAEQRRIALVLNRSEDEIENALETLIALRAQKRGLMQKLLAGEWRLSATMSEQAV